MQNKGSWTKSQNPYAIVQWERGWHLTEALHNFFFFDGKLIIWVVRSRGLWHLYDASCKSCLVFSKHAQLLKAINQKMRQ